MKLSQFVLTKIGIEMDVAKDTKNSILAYLEYVMPEDEEDEEIKDEE